MNQDKKKLKSILKAGSARRQLSVAINIPPTESYHSITPVKVRLTRDIIFDIEAYQSSFNETLVNNNLKYDRDSINSDYRFKSGRNLLFELPYYNTKQSLIYDILSYKSPDKQVNNIRTVLSLLNFDENLDELDNLDEFSEKISTIESLQKRKRSLKSSSKSLSLSKSLSAKTSKRFKTTKGGSTFDEYAKGYLYNHHIFDNRHDFKGKPHCRKNQVCDKFIYDCNDLDINNPDISKKSAELVLKECEKKVLNENEILLNYINYFTNSNLNNFIYISYLDVKNVDILNVNLFGNMIKPQNRNYDTDINNFMKQFTNTDNPAFFTDGKLNRNTSNNLPSFLKTIENKYKTLLTASDIDKIKQIKANTKYLYEKDFLKLHHNFNNYINDRRIISIEDVNDPMSVGGLKIDKFFYGTSTTPPLYDNDMKEVLGVITSNMNNSKNKLGNIFTHKFNLENFEYVYYDTPQNTETNFGFKFNNTDFTKFVKTNKTTLLNNFDFIYLQKKPNSMLYSTIANPTVSQLSSSNIYIGLDISKYKHYNSNKNVAQTINTILGKFIRNPDIKNLFNIINLQPKTSNDYKFAATAFISFYYFWIIGYKVAPFKISTDPKIRYDEIKNLSRLLYDLKKAGDLSKVLVPYYYTELDDTYPNDPSDPVSRGLMKLKNSPNGLIQDQLILSTNDTLTSLSGILRNKSDVFLNMQYNYSYCSYKTSDSLKVTIADLFKQIDLAFGTKFISDNFNIKASIKNVIDNHSTNINGKDINSYVELLKFINKRFIEDPKSIILRNKLIPNNYGNFMNLEIENIQGISGQMRTYYKANYYSATLLYFNYYIFLYIQEFKNKINSIINASNQIYIDKFMKLLFNSLDFETMNIQNKKVFTDITKIYIAKLNFIINKVINKLVKKIESEFSANVNGDNLVNYYEQLILRYTKYISNIVLLLENFLFMDDKNSNIFDNINDLNEFLKNIINICLASTDSNLTISYNDNIKNYNQISMYTILLSYEKFSNILAKIKDITTIKEDILYQNLFDPVFINNLNKFKDFYSVINNIDTSLVSDPILEVYMKNLIHHIQKLIYYIFIQYVIPYYFTKTEDSTFTPQTSGNIVTLLMKNIKENIQTSFNEAKDEKLKPVLSVLASYQTATRSIRQNLINAKIAERDAIAKNFDKKRNEIINKIDNQVSKDLFTFYSQIVTKDLPISEYEPIFFVTDITTIENNGKFTIKLDQILNNPRYNLLFPDVNASLSEEAIIPIIIRDDSYSVTYGQLFNIYNFIIHDTPEYKSQLHLYGGNKKFAKNH